MSERGNFRGGRGAGSSNRGGRGGGRGDSKAGGNAATGTTGEKPKKENILDLSKYMDKEISVKFNGGREGMSLYCPSTAGSIAPSTSGARSEANESCDAVTGTLKGYDQLMNLVLDDVQELLRGSSALTITSWLLLPALGPHTTKTRPVIDDEGNTSTRSLGLIVARGTLLVLISPKDGSQEIANPFVQQEDE